MTDIKQTPAADATPAAPAAAPVSDRGRPRTDTSNLPPHLAAIVARREASRDASEAQRTRPHQLGGVRLKLEVFNAIPGSHLYWANDQNNEVEMLLEEGFDMVRPDEVGMAARIVQDADISNCVSKFVGTKEDGSPLRAYLLKIPEDQWQLRELARYQQADEWDGAIRRGAVNNVDNRYVPQGHEISLKTRA